MWDMVVSHLPGRLRCQWLHYYNHHRLHTALGGHPPAAMSVNNVCGNHS